MKFEATHRRFDIHKPFNEIMNVIGIYKPHSAQKTMIPPQKLRVLYELAIRVSDMDGDVAEAGCWRGGVLYLLASILKNKTIHGFDSWQGVPPCTIEDCSKYNPDLKPGDFGGTFKTDKPVEFLKEFDNIILYEGWFEETFLHVSDKRFCLVNIDCDLYMSIKKSIEFFAPRMVDGGYIVVDDYDFGLMPGSNKAIDQYFTDNSDKYYIESYRQPSCIMRLRHKL